MGAAHDALAMAYRAAMLTLPPYRSRASSRSRFANRFGRLIDRRAVVRFFIGGTQYDGPLAPVKFLLATGAGEGRMGGWLWLLNT